MTIAVIEKGFQVLETLAASADLISLARISEETALPKPTAYRILQTMVKLGYVGQSENSQYYLTAKLGSLAQDGHQKDLKVRVLPAMERLYRQFNENVNLAVLDGLNVHYLHTLETTRPLRMMVQPNAVDEFYTTAVGRAIVSHLPHDEQERLLRAVKIRAFTAKTINSKARLKEILDEARERGWAEEDEETVQGVACLAVPILQEGYPLGGMSLTVPRTRLSKERREEMISALKSADFDV